MLLDSDAKLTKPQCLLITGSSEKWHLPRAHGNPHPLLLRKETTTEATMSLASWSSGTAAPTGKQGPSVSTYLLTIHRELLGHSTNLIPGAPHPENHRFWLSIWGCACSPTAMEGWGGGARAVAAAFWHSWKLHPQHFWVFKTVKGPHILRKQLKTLYTLTWEWLGASLMVTQKKRNGLIQCNSRQ